MKTLCGHLLHSLYIYVLPVLACAALFMGCSDKKTELEHENRTRCTVMVYMSAENSLSGSGGYDRSDVREMMEGAASIPSDCRLLLLWDDNAGTPAIYEISASGDTLRLYTYQESCLADTIFMADAMKRMVQLAPADSYGLVVWSHGSGWLPGTHAYHTRAVIQDDNYNQGGKCIMGIDELAEVLAKGPHLDYIFFDACLMQSVEVAYELRKVTDCIVASPAEIPARGGTYDRLLPYLFTHPFDAKGLAYEYYICEKNYREQNGSGGVVISVLNTSELDSLATVTRRLVDNRDMEKGDAQPYWLNSSQYLSAEFPDFVDILGVMNKFADSPCYEEWRKQLSRTVTACEATDYWDTVCESLSSWSGGYQSGRIADYSTVSGLSIFVPQEKYDYAGKHWNENIRTTAWWQAVYP